MTKKLQANINRHDCSSSTNSNCCCPGVAGKLIIAALLLLSGILFGYYLAKRSVSPPEDVFCTMDAKQCPDGSFVGRVGPNCEFAPCPNGELSFPKNEFSPEGPTHEFKQEEIVIDGNRYSIQLPPAFYLDHGVLANYDPNSETGMGGLSEGTGKCDLLMDQDLVLDDTNLEKTENISDGYLPIKKITRKVLYPNPSGDKMVYYQIGESPNILSAVCYGVWQDDSPELVNILKTVQKF
jgi:hypothetical protein